MKGSNVLVTGGAGFIGSHLVRALVAEGARVRVLDNLSTGRLENLAGLERKIDFHEGDIRNAVACRKACGRVNAVFHLAAYISVPGSMKDPVSADGVNIGGTLNMLLAARDAAVRRFVLSSSSAVYGDTDVLPTHEGVLPRPLSPYGVEKHYGEQMCRIFSQSFDLAAVALRYFNVYGPRQNPHSEYAAVIPKFIAALLAGNAPTIFGDGAQTRDFLFVEDVARANLLAAQAEEAPGEVLNVASGRSISVNELYEAICEATDVHVPAQHGPERPGDVKHSSADIARARDILGYEPSIGLRDGLRRTVEHYQLAIG